VSDTTYETNESMLSEARREAGILRDALAESERLREKAGSAILAMSSSLDLAIEKAEEFRNARDKAEELVAALKKAIAQSSTQYREMVKALEEYGSHQLPCPLAQWSRGRPTKDGGYETMYAGKWYQGDDKPECTCGFSAAVARSTP